MQDFLESCLTDPYFAKIAGSPENFKKEVCPGCNNMKCQRAGGLNSKFSQRISTQEDRLLTNPRFADPKDPRFRDIAKRDFPDMLHRAVVLEVTSRKKDWSVPTEEEISAITSELAGEEPLVAQPGRITPTHFVATEEPEAAPSTWQIRGDSGTDYTVSLHADQSWKCTCPSRVQPCKHIKDVALKLSRGAEDPTPPPVRVPALPPARPPVGGPVFVPRAMNTAMPSEGLMIGGALPPRQKIDPWAPPPRGDKPKPQVVAVGGKVRFGGK